MNTTKTIIFFTKYTADAPVSRYRSYAQKNFLEDNGFDYKAYTLYSKASTTKWYQTGKAPNHFASLAALLKRFLQLLFIDMNYVAVIELPLLPGVSYSLQKWLVRKQKNIVTDLIYTSSEDSRQRDNLRKFLSFSQAIITPDSISAKSMLAIANEVIQIPPCISLNTYASTVPASLPQAEKNIFRIAWIGTGITSHHLLIIKDCLLQLHDLYHIKLVLIGFDIKREKELQGLPYIVHARDSDTEISLLKTCNAGILPLPDVSVPVAALSFPMIQYMACGLPVVASSNEVTISINHGNDNLFARTIFEWYSCLAIMIQNKDFYKDLGKKNETIVNDFYSVEKTQKDYLSLLRNIINN